MAQRNTNEQQREDDIQQGKLLQQVDTLLTNVEKLANGIDDARNRLTILENRVPEVNKVDINELYEFIRDNEEKQTELNQRLTIIETRRATTGEIIATILGILGILIAIASIIYQK